MRKTEVLPKTIVFERTKKSMLPVPRKIATNVNQLHWKSDEIARSVVNEVREIPMHRVTFRSNIWGHVGVTWQQDGRRDEYLSAVVLEMVDGFVQGNRQLLAIG